ncbi:unnamed protein product [Closterium sp. NIES-64]|nr:unnamed protein product [Closterium sp. NIES-64]
MTPLTPPFTTPPFTGSLTPATFLLSSQSPTTPGTPVKPLRCRPLPHCPPHSLLPTLREQVLMSRTLGVLPLEVLELELRLCLHEAQVLGVLELELSLCLQEVLVFGELVLVEVSLGVRAGAPSTGPGESGTGSIAPGGAGSRGGATGALESGLGATTAQDITPPPHPYPTWHQARLCLAREEQLELEREGQESERQQLELQQQAQLPQLQEQLEQQQLQLEEPQPLPHPSSFPPFSTSIVPCSFSRLDFSFSSCSSLVPCPSH